MFISFGFEKMLSNVACIFFIFIFFGITFGVENDNTGVECNYDEFMNDTTIPRTWEGLGVKKYYKFYGGSIYLADEPLLFWLELLRINPKLKFKFQTNPTSSPIVHIEAYGNCLYTWAASSSTRSLEIDLSTCQCRRKQCTTITENNGCLQTPYIFVPLKVLAENGPVKIDMEQGTKILYPFLFKEVEQNLTVDACVNEDYAERNYHELDYTKLLAIPAGSEVSETAVFFNKNGIDYINLIKNVTAIWLKVEDSSPEHFLQIETKNGEILQETFDIGLEANARKPNKTVELLPNGVKIALEKEMCCLSYKFLGYIRYIITVNEVGLLKASFYDSKSGDNLKLNFFQQDLTAPPVYDSSITNADKIELKFTTTTTSTTTTTTTATTKVPDPYVPPNPYDPTRPDPNDPSRPDPNPNNTNPDPNIPNPDPNNPNRPNPDLNDPNNPDPLNPNNPVNPNPDATTDAGVAEAGSGFGLTEKKTWTADETGWTGLYANRNRALIFAFGNCIILAALFIIIFALILGGCLFEDPSIAQKTQLQQLSGSEFGEVGPPPEQQQYAKLF